MRLLGIIVLTGASIFWVMHGVRGAVRRRLDTRSSQLEGTRAVLLGSLLVVFGMALGVVAVKIALQ